MKNISATGAWAVLDKEKTIIYQSRDVDGFMPGVADWQEKWKEQMKDGNKDTVNVQK